MAERQRAPNGARARGDKGSFPPVWVVLLPRGAPRCSPCAHVLPSSSVSAPSSASSGGRRYSNAD